MSFLRSILAQPIPPTLCTSQPGFNMVYQVWDCLEFCFIVVVFVIALLLRIALLLIVIVISVLKEIQNI